MLVFTTTPPGYHPDRYTAWCRWMRIYRKVNVSSLAPPPTGIIDLSVRHQAGCPHPSREEWLTTAHRARRAGTWNQSSMTMKDNEPLLSDEQMRGYKPGMTLYERCEAENLTVFAVREIYEEARAKDNGITPTER